MFWLHTVSYTHLDVYKRQEQQLKTSDIVSDSSALYNNKEISLSDCLNESFIVLDTKNNDPDITEMCIRDRVQISWNTHNF